MAKTRRPMPALPAELRSRPPLERMLRIHELLKDGRTPGVGELARRLEVSGKTVQRDVEFMRERLKLPVSYSRTHSGYRDTEPAAGFPSLQVTEGEVVALLVAQKALEQYRGTRFEDTLRSAFAKLTASMGDESVFSPDAEVSFRPVGVSTHDLAVFETLHTAVRRRREVRFAYRKPRSAADEERRVRPHHLACVQGRWVRSDGAIRRGQAETCNPGGRFVSDRLLDLTPGLKVGRERHRPSRLPYPTYRSPRGRCTFRPDPLRRPQGVWLETH